MLYSAQIGYDFFFVELLLLDILQLLAGFLSAPDEQVAFQERGKCLIKLPALPRCYFPLGSINGGHISFGRIPFVHTRLL